MKFIIPIIATESTSSWYQRWQATYPRYFGRVKNRAALPGYTLTIITVSLFISIISGGIIVGKVPSASALDFYPISTQLFQDPIPTTSPPLVTDTSVKTTTALPVVKPITTTSIPTAPQPTTDSTPVTTATTPMIVSPTTPPATVSPTTAVPVAQVSLQQTAPQNSSRNFQRTLQPAAPQDTYEQVAPEAQLPIDTASQVINTATDQSKSNSNSQPVSYTSGRISDQLRDRIITLAVVSLITAATLYLMSLFGTASNNKRKVLVRYIDPAQELSNR